jgi:hypothetical protein
MNIKKFAEKYIKAEEEAFQKGNFEPLKALEDPNMRVHMPQGYPEMVGHEAHKQQINDSRQIHSFEKQEIKYLTGEGNLFVLSYTASFRVTGEKPGYKLPVGKKVLDNAIIIGRVKKGKVIEGWAINNLKVID